VETKVHLLGVNGETFILAGEGAGDKGVWLASGVTGLFDPPVKAVYEEPGTYPGARYLSHRVLRRDLVFKVYILNDPEHPETSWKSRDSVWRRAWAFDKDCKLFITTDSGIRYLKLRLFESLDISMEHDPNGLTMHECGIVAVAGDPFWYEDDVVFSAVTQTDTTFDPNALQLPWPWPQTELPSEELTITVTADEGGVNPTDQILWPKWTVPGSEFKPAEPYIPGLPWLGAPKSMATLWTLPDYDFDTPGDQRRVRLPGLIGGLRQRGVYKIYTDGRPTAGTWTIKYGDESTPALGVNPSAAEVKAALVALAEINATAVEVTRGPAVNEIQTVRVEGGATSGTFTLNLLGHATPPIKIGATAWEMSDALAQLPDINVLDVKVTAAGRNEVQMLQMVGEPTAGTWTMTFDGQTTQSIPYNATALQVMAALQGLPNVGTFDVVVTRDIFSKWSPYKVTFMGALAGLDLNPITADVSGLSGGAGIDLVVTEYRDEKGQVYAGGRTYEVTFGGPYAGENLPVMTGNVNGLDGGVNNRVVVEEKRAGGRPYIIEFRGALEGAHIQPITVDDSALEGATMRVVEHTESKTYPAENAFIDTDPRVEQVVSESGSPLWSRMNGVRFRNPIPPYTESAEFKIKVSGCRPGQMVTLRLPRAWSRPWGLE
jgi:hypothetical protein